MSASEVRDLLAAGRVDDAVAAARRAVGGDRQDRAGLAELVAAAVWDPDEREHVTAVLDGESIARDDDDRGLLGALSQAALFAGRPGPGIRAAAKAAMTGTGRVAPGTLGHEYARDALTLLGDPEAALPAIASAADHARAADSVVEALSVLASEVLVADVTGDVDGLVDTGLRLERAATQDATMPSGVTGRAFRMRGLLDAGRVAEASALLPERSREPGPLEFLLEEARARVAMARGKAAIAAAAYARAGEQAERVGVIAGCLTDWRSGRTRALAAAGDHEGAHASARAELAIASRAQIAWHIGRAQRGLAAQTRDRAERLALYEQAVATLEGTPARLELARALADFGRSLAGAGLTRDARSSLRASMDLAHHCGARGLAADAWSELVATGARPRRAALTGAAALTPSELRVVRLATAGRSNEGIARELFVTIKTVEWHLTASYRKLGIHSRTELPAALRARRGGP